MWYGYWRHCCSHAQLWHVVYASFHTGNSIASFRPSTGSTAHGCCHKPARLRPDGVWPQVGDKLDGTTIPLGNVSLQTASQQLFIQDNHPTGSSSGSVFRNCSVTSRTASIMA